MTDKNASTEKLLRVPGEPGRREETHIRIVLVGKTGAGKSASGNTILQRKAFKSEMTSSTVTECQKATAKFGDQTLCVVDTPGLFNTRLTEDKIKTELTRCISLAKPGPHVFLIVNKSGRFTKEEEEAVKIIKEKFGIQSARYTMALFTHGDDLKEHDTNIEKIMSEDPGLCELINLCDGGYHIFNNRDMDSSQVRELMKKINTMVQRNGGRYYTNEMLQEAEKTAKEEEKNLRIVLVGKTGAGKSASGNTILQRKAFNSASSFSSITPECEKETVEFDDKILHVVDTPGLFDTQLSQDKIMIELARCISLTAPGPHVFLVVIQAGRFTKEEKETVKLLQEVFGTKAAGYIIALFTRGDDLEEDKTDIDRIIHSDPNVRDFINQCDGRYHVFNNRKKDDPSQVRELVEKMKKMIKENGGRCYTNENFIKAEKAIQDKAEKLLKKHPDMTPKDARKQAEKKNRLIRAIAGSIGGAAAGIGAGIGIEIAIGAGIGAIGGPVGALAGAAVGAGVGVGVGAAINAAKEKKCIIQ